MGVEETMSIAVLKCLGTLNDAILLRNIVPSTLGVLKSTENLNQLAETFRNANIDEQTSLTCSLEYGAEARPHKKGPGGAAVWLAALAKRGVPNLGGASFWGSCGPRI